MIDIQKKQIAYNRSARLYPIEYIVIHDTGNSGLAANAQAHFTYFNNANRDSSADFFVDDRTILQVNDYLAYYTWHCGDKNPFPGPLYGIVNNRNSVGIEICINKDGDYSKAFKNAVDLTKHLMDIFRLTSDKVVRHYDVSGKNCPGSMSHEKWKLWEEFKIAINKEEENEMIPDYLIRKYRYCDGSIPLGLQEELWDAIKLGIVSYGDDGFDPLLSENDIRSIVWIRRTYRSLENQRFIDDVIKEKE